MKPMTFYNFRNQAAASRIFLDSRCHSAHKFSPQSNTLYRVRFESEVSERTFTSRTIAAPCSWLHFFRRQKNKKKEFHKSIRLKSVTNVSQV